MPYEQRKDLPPDDCKRACGVHPQPCDKMRHVRRENAQKKITPRRPAPLWLADPLCMTRPSWRASRPSCPRGRSGGVAEAVVYRTVQRMEHPLSQSQACQWPGKKTCHAGGTPLAVIVVEGAASPLERPQKTSGATTAGRTSATPRKPRSASRQRPAR